MEAIFGLVAALLLLIVPWAVIAACVGHVAGALALRWKFPQLVVVVRFVTGLVTFLFCMTGLVIALGAIANADAASKAALLARGIREVFRCTPLAVPLLGLTLGCGAWLTWRWTRGPRTSD